MSIKEKNLIAYSGTLKKGQRLVKVGNTFMPIGVGGAFEPGNGEADTSTFEAAALAIIGDENTIPDIPIPDAPTVTGSCKLYKCASVDTTNKTWTGYELLLQDGVYVVSDIETTGLTYAGFTPSVNTMYNEDATFIISDLFSKSDTLEGCVFAANMQSNEAMYNGETITLEGVNIVAAPDYTDGTKALSSDINLPFDGANIFADGNSTVAVSAYFVTNASNSPTFVDMERSDGGTGIEVYQQYSGGKTYTNIYGEVSYGFNFGFRDCGSFGWHHIVIQNKGNEFGKLFVDGVLIATLTETSGFDVVSGIKTINSLSTLLRGAYMKDLQIYNRALDAAEVEDLYAKAKLPTA